MNKELIEYLKLAHGTYNTFIILLFFYQGILGLKIRRSEGGPPRIIRRHRKIGPLAAVLGTAGFFAGMTVVFLDEGRIFKYPLHFITGMTITILIITAYLISKKIKGPDRYWRDRHYTVGILILCLYFVQVFLGLGVLL